MEVKQTGKASPYKPACDYVSQPKGAYGKASGLQPFKARNKGYTPDTSTKKR